MHDEIRQKSTKNEEQKKRANSTLYMSKDERLANKQKAIEARVVRAAEELVLVKQ